MRGDDRGVSLIELLVVMSLLLLTIVMFGSAFSVMLQTSRASTAMGDATDEMRLALNELERQVRFGYWVRAETTLGCEDCAVTVLTRNADGTNECWTWALDTTDPVDGKLLSVHRALGAPFTMPSLGSDEWHIAASGVRSDVNPATLVTAGDELRPLDATTLTRVSYYGGAEASLWLASPGEPSSQVPFRLEMSIRNGWRGASLFTGACL